MFCLNLFFRCLQSEQASIVQERTLLLLLWWIKDYYSIDFHGNSKLCKMAQEFIEEVQTFHQ